MDNECSCAGGFYGRFCHLSDSTGEDSCAAHPCLNGGNCEDGSCLCPAAFSGNRCQDKLTSVECGSGSMTVTIDKRLVPGNANAVHFINQSCFGVESSNSDEITLSTNYRECGTTLTDDVSTMTFSNVITYEKPEAEGDTAITREYQMQLRVECCLNKSETVDGSFKPRLGKVAFSDKSTGNFDLNLARFKTENIQEVDSSSVSLGQELFFEVSLKSVEILGMFIESCWATATVDPATNPHHSLISSRCPEDPTTSINNDLDLDRESFSFKAFAFTGDNQNTQVYVHCLVMVCGAEEARLNRDMGCPSNDGEAAFWNSSPVRKRRSTSSLSTQTISSGPIRIRNPTSGMATNDVSLYNPFAMLILGISAAVVAMLILMGVVKLVGTNFNYHRVSTETI
ncbi:ZP domain-containing protein-like [Lytechinus variegatus]|uniref:ZP domain-containing protein-like n=1 Tax=Lytechinus variegatus TaxID=7654 RepID=UPI001BB15C6D|nr:ZP domain-containing protein-like [Lytechinus variegatus]